MQHPDAIFCEFRGGFETRKPGGAVDDKWPNNDLRTQFQAAPRMLLVATACRIGSKRRHEGAYRDVLTQPRPRADGYSGLPCGGAAVAAA